MHARFCAGAESAQRITFGVIIAFAAAYLALSGGCPANEPVDLSNPLELQGDGLLADGIDPLGGEAGEPFAFDYEVATIQNQPVAVSLTAEGLSDLNWDFSIVSEPAHGSVSQIRWVDQSTAEVTYTPEQDFVGQAQFSYQVSAGAVRSNVATVIITVYPEVRFDVEVITEQPHLTVLAYAFTRTGEELPEGTYAWQFDDYQDSGPVATHSAREYAFTSGGSHVITLTLTLAGLAAPISCSTGLSGGDKEFRMSSSGQAGVLVVLPADGFESSGTQGGPFDPGSKSYVLTNTGSEPFEWSASKAQSWVSLSQISGTLAPGDSATVVVSINDNANDLDPGSYTDTVTFLNKTNGDGDTMRAVSLTVNSSRAGALEVLPSDGLSSSGYQGGPFSPDSKTYTLTNTGDEPIAWSASNLEDWVSLSSAGGSLPPGESEAIVVSINDNASSLAPGSYSDTVHFTNHTNGVGSTTRGVSLTVNTPPEPGMLVVSPDEGFESSGPEGGPFDPPSAEYVLANVGDEPIEWEATHSELWLDLLPDSGSLEPGESVTVVVSIGDGSRALAPGEYNDQVEFVNITNGIGDTSRAVALTVNPTNGMLFVLPVGGFSSSGTEGGPFTPESQPYTLANVGGLPIEWTASRTQNWITLAPTSGTLSPGASVDVVVSINANADALSPGVYSDTVSFANTTNGSGDTERAVLLTVTATDDLVISGRVTDSGGAALSGVTINGLPGDPVTNASGDYSAIVDYGFSGTAVPSRDGYDFSPASRTYDNIAANQLNQDYVGTLQTFTISGRVTDADGAAISDVTINGLPGDPVTNSSGDYSATVPYGWSGTATPSKVGYTFSPPSLTYSNVTSNQTGQDYVGTLLTFTISGRVTDGEGTGIVDVTINGLPGDPVTNGSGDYSATVPYGWSGTATPSRSGYTFAPASRSYSTVTSNQTNQNYTGTLLTFTISGRVTDSGGAALSGVTINGLPGDPVTNSSGDYSATVPYGWSGTATPSRGGYTFAPASRSYSNVTNNQTSQNYTGTASGSPAPLQAPYSDQPIAVDGAIGAGEWSDANSYDFDGSDLVPPGVVVQGELVGPSDTSATVYVKHDADYVYVALAVTDDTVVQNAADVWDADVIELFLDHDNSDTPDIGLDRMQFDVNAGGQTTATPLVPPNSWTGAASLTSNGYSVEFRISKAAFGLTMGAYGFDIAISDVEPVAGSIETRYWYFSTTAAEGDESQWGDLVLEAGPGQLYVAPGDGFTSSGQEGGPFTPSSKTYTLENIGGEPIDWQALEATDWVDVSPTSGTLAPSASVTVTVSINAAANDFSPGTYGPEPVDFRNITNGAGDTSRNVTLTVSDSGGDPLPMTTASRTSGVVPLAVFFEAAPPANGVVQPTENIVGTLNYASQEYVWDFGDPNSGSWTTGRQRPNGTYPSRNEATGYTAAHVFENPGTYHVTLSVLDAAGQPYPPYTEVITVQEFSGTTYYVSSSEGDDDFDGLSPAAPFETLSRGVSSLGVGERLLLKRADTFPVNQSLGLPNGSTLGAYGSGASPIIQVTAEFDPVFSTINRSDVRVMDVYIDGSSVVTTHAFGVWNTTDLLALRVAFDGGKGWGDYYGDKLFIVDSVQTNSSLCSLYANCNRLVLLGNTFDWALGSHNLYLARIDHGGVISSNNIWKPTYVTHAGHCMRIGANHNPSWFVVVTDNDFDGYDTWLAIHLGISGLPWDETTHLDNLLFERNTLRNAGTLILQNGDYRNLTLCQNDFQGGFAFAINQNNGIPDESGYDGPRGVWFHDNTITNGGGDWFRDTSPSSQHVYVYDNTVNGEHVPGDPPP